MENERSSRWGLWVMLVVNPFVILFVQNCSFMPTSQVEGQMAQSEKNQHPSVLQKQSRGIASVSAPDLSQPEVSPASHCKFVKKSCSE